MKTHSALRHALAVVLLCGWASAPSPVLAQSAAPGPEHELLKVFVGEWDLNAESKAVPALGMNDSGKVVYHHVNEMTNGGFFLETHRTGMSARGPVSELFVYGYNPASKTYRQDGYGSRGQVRTFTATVSGLVWSFTGTNTNLDGSGTMERYTLTYASDLQSATVRSEHSKDGVTWYERLTGTYTKVRGRSMPIDVGNDRVAWFDITTTNMEKSKEFYGHLFDWKFGAVPGTSKAVEIISRGQSIGTIRVANGQITPSNGVVYVQVADIQESCNKATELGATVVPGFPFNLSGRPGAICLFSDPAGHPMGLYSRTPMPR